MDGRCWEGACYFNLGWPRPSAPLSPRSSPSAAHMSGRPQTRLVLLTHSVACFSFENMDGRWCSDGGSLSWASHWQKRHLYICLFVRPSLSLVLVLGFMFLRDILLFRSIFELGKHSCPGQFIERLLKEIHTSRQTKCWKINRDYQWLENFSKPFGFILIQAVSLI